MTDPNASGYAEAVGQAREGMEGSPVPYHRNELLRSILRPHAGMEIALGYRERMIASIEAADHLGLLSGALLIVSVVAAIPYGLIAPTAGVNPWVPDGMRIVLLYVGSLALCFPSLHVFSTFLGLRLRGLQVLTLAVLVTAVAASFSFGFFPIAWFIDLTTDADAGGSVDAQTLSTLLLVLGLAMGIAQLLRCVLSERIRSRTSLLPVLVACWLVLLVFIVHRMAGVLELW